MINKKILFLIPPSFLYPMGAAYVAEVLRNKGYCFDLYAFFYDESAWLRENIGSDAQPGGEAIQNITSSKSHERLYDVIAKKQYDYVLVGGLVGFFRWFYHMLPPIKSYCPGATIIMGGGITKDIAENILFENLAIDYILKGEAETNLCDLLTLLDSWSLVSIATVH